MINRNMFRRLKYCVRNSIFLFVKMLRIIFKKILNLCHCKLLWLVVTLTVIFVIWNSGEVDVDVTKVTNYPVILWWTSSFPGTSELIKCSDDLKCFVYSDRGLFKNYKVSAYLFYATNINFSDLPLPRRQKDVVWGLYHEESPRNVEELLHEEALNIFNFSSTFSRFSDLPFPLQHLLNFDDITSRKYFIATSVKDKLLNGIAPILYLQSDCETSTERDDYVKELMKYIKVDSYGACLNNKDLPSKFKENYLNNLDEDEFLKFIARYKFVIAIENGVCHDYVTEKFWRAIKVGNVPIYFGSPSIRDWFPNNKSAVLIEDFPAPKILYEHIMNLLNNTSLYEEYLEHKTKQVITNQRLKDEFRLRPYQLEGMKTVRKFECFVCTKQHNKINGKLDVNIVNKSHYDCPKPISALTLKVNPWNSWVYSWRSAQANAKEMYKSIIEKD